LKRASLAAGMAFAALTAGWIPMASHCGQTVFGVAPLAAQTLNTGERVVIGTVVDVNSAPQSGATVFLKDLKSKAIRSNATTPDGSFRFTQVDMAEDHELWAEKDGKKSAVKTISVWDTRKEMVVELKLK
jgi:hypothetical protein